MKNLFWLIPILFLINSCRKIDTDIKTSAVFNPTKTYGLVRDIDGNEYKTITIGNQTWMAENLRTTHYRNGDPIPNIMNSAQWADQISGSYCVYNNSIDKDSITTFGFLYNGYAVLDSRNIAPEGWHIPTDAEWDSLETFVSQGDAETTPIGNGIAGGRLKEAGELHWGYANHADNESGLTILPGGERKPDYNYGMSSSNFRYIGYYGSYWTSTLSYNGLWQRLMVPDFVGISRNQISKAFGISVRCVKD